LIVPATLGRWELVEPLSVSGRSSVYRARPLGCRSDGPADYVVKCIEAAHRNNPLAVGMLQREAFVGRSVSHPHLAPVLAAHVDAPPYYFVMPRLEGATLARTLADAVRLEAAEALWIARQTAEALAAMHDAGWRHGDVKPANLFLAASGHVTLIDLGFAGRIPQRRQADEPICGTPAYTAPECLSPAHAVTRQADVYSLGVTLFEMLAGERPFGGDEAEQLVVAHAQNAARDVRHLVPTVPKDVSQLVRRMLAKEPLRRPSTSELVAQLIRLEIECFDVRCWAA
jgi:serine/threonine-protein kinase